MAPKPKADGAASGDDAAVVTFNSTFVSALWAALLAFGLAVPILALRTDQNMANQLILVPRWNYVVIAVLSIFALAFLQLFKGEGRWFPGLLYAIASLTAVFLVGDDRFGMMTASGDAIAPLATFVGKTAVGAVIASAIEDAIGMPGAVTRLPVTPLRLKEILNRARCTRAPFGVEA